MDKSTALRKLRKILGKKFGYREAPTALVGEQRAQALIDMKGAQQQLQEARRQLTERREALLQIDPEYQRLLGVVRLADSEARLCQSVAYVRRITVGTVGELFFHVEAEGDNWQEVVDKVTAKGK